MKINFIIFMIQNRTKLNKDFANQYMRIDVYVNQAKDLTTLVSFYVSQICQAFSHFYAFICSISAKFNFLYPYLNWWHLTKSSKDQHKHCPLCDIFSKILIEQITSISVLSFHQIFLLTLHIIVVSHVCHFLFCCEPFKGKDRTWDKVGIFKMLNEWRKD